MEGEWRLIRQLKHWFASDISYTRSPTDSVPHTAMPWGFNSVRRRKVVRTLAAMIYSKNNYRSGAIPDKRNSIDAACKTDFHRRLKPIASAGLCAPKAEVSVIFWVSRLHNALRIHAQVCPLIPRSDGVALRVLLR